MIIDFATIRNSFYTPEESDRLDEIQSEFKKLDIKYRKEHGKEFNEFQALYNSDKPIDLFSLEGWKRAYCDQKAELLGEAYLIKKEAKQRYKEARGVEGILEDIRTIVEAYTKEDFLDYIKGVKDRIKASKFIHIVFEGLTEEETKAILVEQSKENFSNLYFLLVAYTTEPYNALDREDTEARERATQIIKDRCIALGYKEEPIKEDASELPTIPKYDFIYPTDLQQNLTKASSTLFNSKNSLEELRQIAIDVSPNKKGLTTTYSVNVDLTAPELKGTENVTEYDKSVHNMAVSIGRANEHGFFTAKQVATALLYGDNPSNSNPSKQQIGAVTKSIEKLSLIRLTIDWTEHIKLNNKGYLPEDASSFKVTDYMLPVRKYTATINGQKVEGYEFIDKRKYTPLNHYATSVGQIGQHPVKMLNIPINLDQTKIVIRDFLLEEIAHIKKREGWNRTISVERLLEVAGENSQTITRKKKSLLLTSVKDMLTYWKKEDYIKGYTENIKAKSIQSFTIEV